MWKSRVGIAVCLGIAAFASAAEFEIPMLLPGERVASTLAPTGDTKAIGYAGIEGAKLAVTVRATHGSKVKPKLSLVAPDGSSVDVGDTNPKGASSARFGGVALGSTGTWQIVVRTPSNAGGDFVLTTKGNAPRRFRWKETTGAASVEHEFPAAPGGVASVGVVSKGADGFDPTLELISPSGAVLSQAAGARGRAKIPYAELPEIGRYRVRVSGGPGPFAVSVSVKPAKRRTVTFRDVEARPHVTGFEPSEATNQQVLTVRLEGLAFSTQQTVSVTVGSQTIAAGAVKQALPTSATAQIDLAEVPPGTYSVRVTTKEGNASFAPGTITLSNRTPGVLSVFPYEFSNREPVDVDVRGAGFDTGATVALRRSSDGAVVPVTVSSQFGHDLLELRVAPDAYVTGPLELEIRDPDGTSLVAPGAIDLLGFREAPRKVLDAPPAYSTFYTRDAVLDETRHRVLAAIQSNFNTCSFVLFDPDTFEVLGSTTVSGTYPRVAWDPVGHTFALCYIAKQPTVGRVRIVSDEDLSFRFDHDLSGSADAVSQVHAAADRVQGGYVVVWEETKSTGAAIMAQPLTSTGALVPGQARAVVTNLRYHLHEPVIAWQEEGRFVVAWLAVTPPSVIFEVHATVLDASGAQTLDGPWLTSSSPNWVYLLQPELARNPNDGSMLLAFSYRDSNVFRPACQRLVAHSAAPGPVTTLDNGLSLPEGLLDSLVWNPARNEFVVALTNAADQVAVRRVDPDGKIRPIGALESYEGIWGILYAGAAADSLGLLRTFDGVEDGRYEFTPTLHALAGPLR